MDKIINDRYSQFKKYCSVNLEWLKNQKIPLIKQYQKKEAILIEFRDLPHLFFLILNSIRVLGNEWSHTIVCGTNNYDFICNIVKTIRRQIRIIKIEKDNLTRLDYSVMLLNSKFYEKFYGEYLLIYQEDTILFRDIPQKYFKYDFVGAPLPNKINRFNGGLSLRNKKCMINICKRYYDKYNEKFLKSKSFLEEKILFLKRKGIDYKSEIKYYFLYLIEESLLEDILICEKITRIPSFKDANEFSVEKYYYKNPVGGHQFWYSVKKIDLWLDINLKKISYY